MQGEPVCSLVAPDPCRACRLAGWLAEVYPMPLLWGSVRTGLLLSCC